MRNQEEAWMELWGFVVSKRFDEAAAPIDELGAFNTVFCHASLGLSRVPEVLLCHFVPFSSNKLIVRKLGGIMGVL